MTKPEPWVKYDELPDGGGRFSVSPLKRGMGITLGNSLRRVLLSSLAGAAITSIKIDGVKHEFSSVPNVIEDVLDIIFNIKGVIFKLEGDEPKTLKLSTNKKGKLAAKDIEIDGDVEILNPDHHLVEIIDKGKVEIEMVLRKGIGYSPSELNMLPNDTIDTIVIDASFSPIVRVNHEVESIRVGKELDYDKLTLDVWTNGSVTPEDAVREASTLLVKKFGLFGAINEEPEAPSNKKDAAEEEEEKESTLNLTVDDLELSARSSNCLKRAGIRTVGELVEKELTELIQIKNFGKKSADEINEKLAQYGLELK